MLRTTKGLVLSFHPSSADAVQISNPCESIPVWSKESTICTILQCKRYNFEEAIVVQAQRFKLILGSQWVGNFRFFVPSFTRVEDRKLCLVMIKFSWLRFILYVKNYQGNIYLCFGTKWGYWSGKVIWVQYSKLWHLDITTMVADPWSN